MNLTFAFTSQPLPLAVADAIYAEKFINVFWHTSTVDSYKISV